MQCEHGSISTHRPECRFEGGQCSFCFLSDWQHSRRSPSRMAAQSQSRLECTPGGENAHVLIHIRYLFPFFQAIYLQNATRVIPSLKLLALVLSLPLVLLSWSLMTFAFAIAIYTFKSRPWWTYASVGVVLFSVVFAIVFTILFFWDIFTYRQGINCTQAAWKHFFYPTRGRTLNLV